VEITEWSSFMDRPTHKDSNKIYFVFSYISTNFCEFLKSESIFGNYLNAKGIEKGNHEMCRIRPTALVQMTARPAPLDGPTVAPSPAAGPARPAQTFGVARAHARGSRRCDSLRRAGGLGGAKPVAQEPVEHGACTEQGEEVVELTKQRGSSESGWRGGIRTTTNLGRWPVVIRCRSCTSEKWRGEVGVRVCVSMNGHGGPTCCASLERSKGATY
jgi:hypothetical protein